MTSPSPAARIRILLVDDHAMVRRGMRDFLELHDDLEVVGEAAMASRRVERGRELRPDVVVMDLLMPGMDGIEATARIKAALPAIEVVALTSFIEEDAGRRARGGRIGLPAQGCRGRRAGGRDPGGRGGEVHLDPAVAGIVARGCASSRRGGDPRREPDGMASLTAREHEVLGGVARGRSNRAIADELAITERTARTHVSNILAKLGAGEPDAGRPARRQQRGLGPRVVTPSATRRRRRPVRRARHRVRPRDAADPSRWAAQVDGAGRRVPGVALDLPGHGALGGRAVHAGRRADEVPGSSSGGRRPAVVVGLSLGGYVAMDLAAREPEHVRGLVLSGATAEPVGLRATAVPRARVGHRAVRRAGASWRLNAWFFRTRYPAAIADPIIAGGFWSAGGAAALRALVGERFAPRLAAYRGPTLILNGELDLLFRLVGGGRSRPPPATPAGSGSAAPRTWPTSTGRPPSPTRSGGSSRLADRAADRGRLATGRRGDRC